LLGREGVEEIRKRVTLGVDHRHEIRHQFLLVVSRTRRTTFPEIDTASEIL
jgi:hypothetical protein